jgi:hypothetical protein
VVESPHAGPTYVRVYADAEGETHFEDVGLPRERRESPTGTVDEVTTPIPVEGVVFRLVVSEASDIEPHNAPRRLFIVQVDGAVEVEVSDGEKREFGPGAYCSSRTRPGRATSPAA